MGQQRHGHAAARRSGAVRWCAVLAAVLSLSLPASPGAADPTADRLKETREALEESSAEVQAAGVALVRTSAGLPAARSQAASATAQLTVAQARTAAALRAVRVGEVALASATRRADLAKAAFEISRDQFSRLAARAYQLGPFQQVTALARSGPAEFLERKGLLDQAFTAQGDSVRQLTADRVQLEGQQAKVRAAQDALDAARARAGSQQARAATLRSRAVAALDRVQSLVAERSKALAVAESGRAADLREYQEAQAASRELARRIREAARSIPRSPAAVGQMLWPAAGPLTSRYGFRTHPIYGGRRFHAGIDIGAGQGVPIIAADSGTVVFAGSSRGYGNLVVISHGTSNGRDLSTAYAHQSAILVSPGERVGRGQQIGRVGSTGNSTGPHLHFEVRLDGDPVQPLDYVSPP